MAKRAVLGFFGGVRAIFGGIGFVVTRPSVWLLAAVPVVAATALFVGLSILAVAGGHSLAERFFTSATTLSSIGAWSVRVLAAVVGIILAFFVAISLAQPLSSFALEGLAQRQARALGGRAPVKLPFWPGVGRSLRVSLTAILIGAPVLGLLALVTLLFPPASVVTLPLKFIVTGILAAYDFLDYPLSLRGAGVRERLAFMRREIWAVLGFGVGIAAVLLVPGVGLLLLPFGVAGATRLVVEADRRQSPA